MSLEIKLPPTRAMSEPVKSNIPEFSVGELAMSLKKTLEDNFGRVRVRGELSRVSIAASGHMYSSIKDEDAVIDAICWKGTLHKLSIKPEEGIEVICTGRITTYPARSNYQIIIESMELAGEGALLKMLEERKKRLAAEGLFDEERKKPLPFLPQTIGVVTSPTGAVIRDIIHRLRDRFPCRVLVNPVRVQGETSGDEVAKAIAAFDSIKAGANTPRPDVIIVARGGGSLEDLMGFNDETVVRAVAGCSIPVISAVGHETDTTLIDYASDARAPTPTGAAEIAVPVRAQLVAGLLDYEQRLLGALLRKRDHLASNLKALARALGDPARIMDIQAQKLDHTGQRLNSSFRGFINLKQQRYMRASNIQSPHMRIDYARQSLNTTANRLTPNMKTYLKDRQTNLSQADRLLEGLSFKRVLERGFAVVRNDKGHIISEASALKSGQKIELEFKDNQKREAVIDGKTATKKKPKTPSDDQGALF